MAKWIKRTEVIEGCTLHLGDASRILDEIDTSILDAAIFDPPYGVGLKYTDATEDDRSIVERVNLPVLEMLRLRVKRVALTPGVKNLMRYPEASHIGSFYYPAGAGLNSWGFTCWQPILYYGKDPYGGKGSRPDSFVSTEAAEKSGHPCPKPIQQMMNLVNRASLPREHVIDPFMGSGTTGVACIRLGRSFTGIELDPSYFEIACERIRKAYQQPDMFVTQPSKPEQVGLDF